jgi:hypothetical protein
MKRKRFLLVFFYHVDIFISLLWKIQLLGWCTFAKLEGSNVLISVEYVWKVER